MIGISAEAIHGTPYAPSFTLSLLTPTTILCAGNMEESKLYLDKFIGLAPILTPVDWLSCGGDEFLVGRAGYLAGVLWLRAKLGLKVITENVVLI